MDAMRTYLNLLFNIPEDYINLKAGSLVISSLHHTINSPESRND